MYPGGVAVLGCGQGCFGVRRTLGLPASAADDVLMAEFIECAGGWRAGCGHEGSRTGGQTAAQGQRR